MKNFNYNITKFFIDRPKLVVMAIIILIFAGIFATISLKTTGFPNATLGILTVQTVYPGASAETIAKDITTPIEEQIKGLSDIDTFNSTSANSFSIVVITLKSNVNVDTFRNKLESAVGKSKLPTGVEKPTVSVPSIGSDDYQFTIASNNRKNIYDKYQDLQKKLKSISDIQSVSSPNEVKKRISIKIDASKLKTSGVTVADIKSKLSTIDESLPVVSGVEFENISQTILTSISNNSLDDAKSLQFTKDISLPDGSKKSLVSKLSEFAEIDTVYEFENGDSLVGINPKYSNTDQDSQFKSVLGMTVSIKAVAGASGSVISDKIDKILSDEFSSPISKSNTISSDNSENKTYLVRNYVVNDDTQKQVGEVISGLIGGNLEVDNNFKYLGWILGGIQLIVLVMILFVSWRAALIGALAIPLSLIFANIYLFAIGESLNTLVLFSLVLVVGLVVDPALVMLEAVQRKYDIGLKGNDAILAAIKDVGNGIFLATITNIIVFLPFALISGVLGQIFSYIPMTIIPATIGSYFVPLIFLSWLGGKLLKPSKSSIAGEKLQNKMHVNKLSINERIDENPEFQNMWSVSKLLVKLNYKLLTGNRWLRAFILILGIAIPFAVAGIYFGGRLVKSTQFSQVGGNGIITINYVQKSDLTKSDGLELQKSIFEEIGKSAEIAQVFPYQRSGQGYFFAIIDKSQIDKTKSILSNIKSRISQDANIQDKIFDIQIAELSSAGGGSSSYQVNIAVKSSDLELSRKAAGEVAAVANQVCYLDSKVTITDNCTGTRIVTKVDDGFTGKENKIIDIVFDRSKIAQFAIANTPATFMLNQTVKGLYQYSTSKVGTVNVNGENLEIYLDDPDNAPKSISELSNVQVYSLTGQVYKLSDIATIVPRDSKSNITKLNAEQLSVVQIRLAEGFNDQAISGLVTNAIVNHFSENDYASTKVLGLDEKSIDSYSAGGFASFLKSFSELGITLILAILITYIVLCIFFDSLLIPITILYTIPLTFIGIFPALAHLATGEFGFLEIIGLIILVGIVENVAIFLIDAARAKINEGWDAKSAISFAAGIRFRPVILTTVCAIASLAPLALFSPFYRSLSLVIMFGLATSGVISLITTPLLFIAFRREKKVK